MEREARKVHEEEHADNTKDEIALRNIGKSKNDRNNTGFKDNQMQCRK